MSASPREATKPRVVLKEALGTEQPAATIEREGRRSTNCTNCILVLNYRGREAQPGSAGLGFYQAGSLRAVSRLITCHAVQGCYPAHSSF